MNITKRKYLFYAASTVTVVGFLFLFGRRKTCSHQNKMNIVNDFANDNLIVWKGFILSKSELDLVKKDICVLRFDLN